MLRCCTRWSLGGCSNIWLHGSHVYLPVVKHSSLTVSPAIAIREVGEVATNCTGTKLMVGVRSEGGREGGREGGKNQCIYICATQVMYTIESGQQCVIMAEKVREHK